MILSLLLGAMVSVSAPRALPLDVMSFKDKKLGELMTWLANNNVDYVPVIKHGDGAVTSGDYGKRIVVQEGGPAGGAPGDPIPEQNKMSSGFYISVILYGTPPPISIPDAVIIIIVVGSGGLTWWQLEKLKKLLKQKLP